MGVTDDLLLEQMTRLEASHSGAFGVHRAEQIHDFFQTVRSSYPAINNLDLVQVGEANSPRVAVRCETLAVDTKLNLVPFREYGANILPYAELDIELPDGQQICSAVVALHARGRKDKNFAKRLESYGTMQRLYESGLCKPGTIGSFGGSVEQFLDHLDDITKIATWMQATCNDFTLHGTYLFIPDDEKPIASGYITSLQTHAGTLLTEAVAMQNDQDLGHLEKIKASMAAMRETDEAFLDWAISRDSPMAAQVYEQIWEIHTQTRQLHDHLETLMPDPLSAILREVGEENNVFGEGIRLTHAQVKERVKHLVPVEPEGYAAIRAHIDVQQAKPLLAVSYRADVSAMLGAYVDKVRTIKANNARYLAGQMGEEDWREQANETLDYGLFSIDAPIEFANARTLMFKALASEPKVIEALQSPQIQDFVTTNSITGFDRNSSNIAANLEALAEHLPAAEEAQRLVGSGQAHLAYLALVHACFIKNAGTMFTYSHEEDSMNSVRARWQEQHPDQAQNISFDGQEIPASAIRRYVAEHLDQWASTKSGVTDMPRDETGRIHIQLAREQLRDIAQGVNPRTTIRHTSGVRVAEVNPEQHPLRGAG